MGGPSALTMELGASWGDDEYFEGEISRFPHGNSIGYMKIEESRTL